MNENLTLQLSQVYKQSRKRVFAAWTTPEQVAKWFAPGQFKADSVEVEPWEGGAFRVVWTGLSPHTGLPIRVQLSGVYEQFVADELLRFSWAVNTESSEATLVTVEFRDVEGGTKVSMTQERIDSQALLDRNRGGWSACLENLAKVCESEAA